MLKYIYKNIIVLLKFLVYWIGNRGITNIFLVYKDLNSFNFR